MWSRRLSTLAASRRSPARKRGLLLGPRLEIHMQHDLVLSLEVLMEHDSVPTPVRAGGALLGERDKSPRRECQVEKMISASSLNCKAKSTQQRLKHQTSTTVFERGVFRGDQNQIAHFGPTERVQTWILKKNTYDEYRRLQQKKYKIFHPKVKIEAHGTHKRPRAASFGLRQVLSSLRY